MTTALSECRAALTDPNMQAFLRVIRAGESSQGDDAYRTIVGGGLLDSFADHPRKLVHIASLGLDSTAAGAYQFLSRTWDGCVKALSLHDFSPPMQDIAAVYLIRGRGALQDVLAGRLGDAIAKCAREWASLPGSPYGQPTRTMAQARAVYESYGGAYAPAGAAAGAPQPLPPASAAPPAAPIPAGEAADWPPPEKSMPIPALIGVLATSLIEAFAPLAREKITKEIARHTDSPQVADQVATAVIETVKAATGKSDPIEAVAAAKSDPVIMQQAETSALDTLDRLAPMLDKMAAWEKSAWDANEDSKRAAAERGRADAHDLAPMLAAYAVRGIYGMIAALTLIIIAQIVFTDDHRPMGELVTLLGSLMMLAATKNNTVYDYRFGSSRSSGAKDVVIGELSRRKA